MRLTSTFHKSVLTFTLGALAVAFAAAQHPVAPQLSSNPGARYTVFLNFTGFDYSGTWAGKTPGNVPAYSQDADKANFNTAELDAIRETWARVSQAYVGFNINVTTIDPSPSGLTDAQRKTWYDNTQYMTHTIIGGAYNWYGQAGGVSGLSIAQQATTNNGQRTNWVFPENGTGTTPKYMSAAIIHEDGHHLRLNHQSDESNGGAYSTNNGVSGNGTYAPIMGASYYSQRGTWRVGKTGVNANDVSRLQGNLNMGPLLDDGIGHSLATATALAVATDGTVNATLSKGFIMPTAAASYSPSVYTTDYFKFTASGGFVSLTANDGTQFLQPGVADPGATMRSVLKILDSSGTVVGTATEDATTLLHTWSGNLAAGNYFAQVTSYGAYVSSYEPDSRYFNMGAYFLSGSINPVPEPATMIAMMGGIGLLLKRRRKKAA